MVKTSRVQKSIDKAMAIGYIDNMLKVYVDTSVIGGCLDEEFSEWSCALFDEFKLGLKIPVIADITLQELESAPTVVKNILSPLLDKVDFLSYNDEADNLAKAYVQEGVVTPKFLVDAQHIALASICRVDVLVSWNFKHIVNLNRIRQYNAVNLKIGYPMIDIRTPREVLSEKEN